MRFNIFFVGQLNRHFARHDTFPASKFKNEIINNFLC